MEVVEYFDIDSEAHVAKINILESTHISTVIVANVHAPCPHNQQKVLFFKKIRDIAEAIQAKEENDCKLIILGDFNLTFDKSERLNTLYSDTERKIGDEVRDVFNNFELTDCWEGNRSDMTWRHGTKMSRLDRIMWSSDFHLGKYRVTTDWTYVDSDHAAVIVHMTCPRRSNANKVVRIDTKFMQSTILKHIFLKELKLRNDQIADTNMDPHQKL